MTDEANYPKHPPQWWIDLSDANLFYPGERISLVPDKAPRHRVPAVVLGIATKPGRYIVARWILGDDDEGRWTKRSEFDAVIAQFKKGD